MPLDAEKRCRMVRNRREIASSFDLEVDGVCCGNVRPMIESLAYFGGCWQPVPREMQKISDRDQRVIRVGIQLRA
jgi:hypothetical protein